MKKAQISMFVIIGIILLFAAGMFFFISNELQEDKPVVDVPDVSLETRPAVQLIESCLESTAEQGIRLISAQGGYNVAPDPHILPQRGSSIVFSPYNVAYWRYMEEEDCLGPRGCPASKRPPLCKISSSNKCDGLQFGDDSIEEQLESYILDNIDSCLNDLQSISDFFDLAISDERSLDISFLGGQTTILMDNELISTSRSTDNTKEVEQFRAVLDVDMLNMYRIASETLDAIQVGNPYERQTMNMISIYSCEDNSCLPPTDVLSIGRSNSAFWVQETVKDTLEGDVLPLMSFITYNNFDNVNNLERFDDEDYGEYNHFVDGFYSSFRQQVGQEAYYGYELHTIYPHSPLEFQIDDGKQRIVPKKIDQSSLGFAARLMPFVFADMRFNYFMRYPLVLQLKDTQAFNGEGIDFNFGVEVAIDANEPAYDEVLVVNLGSAINSVQLDDFENMPPRMVRIETRDKYTGDFIDDVVITYQCLDSYEMGSTSFQPNNQAYLDTRLPHCEFGGFLVASKLGYSSVSIPFDNPQEAADARIEFELWPLAEKEIIVYKRNAKNIENLFRGALFNGDTEFVPFESTETVMVNIENIKDSSLEDRIPPIGFGVVDDNFDYGILDSTLFENEQLKLISDAIENGDITQEQAQEIIELSQESSFSSTDLAEIQAQPLTMQFVPGQYEVELTLIKYGAIDQETGEYTYALSVPNYVVPGKDRLILPDEPDIPLDGVNLSTWVSGGGSVNIDITEEMLYESDEPIILYTLEIPIPTRWDCKYLQITNPDDSDCNAYGYCGEYVPEDETKYCVSFQEVIDIEEYELDKKFLIAPGILS